MIKLNESKEVDADDMSTDVQLNNNILRSKVSISMNIYELPRFKECSGFGLNVSATGTIGSSEIKSFIKDLQLGLSMVDNLNKKYKGCKVVYND